MRYQNVLSRLVDKTARDQCIYDERVIEAIKQVPRHLFVDEAFRPRAYTDDALPIGFGQTISKVSTVMRMTDALELSEGDRVLEVGAGSGYQTAVLGILARDLYAVERLRALTVKARRCLHKLGIFHPNLRSGDGALGWPEAAPFQCILVAAAANEVPRPLLEQLDVGGRFVLPVAEGRGQQLIRIRRTAADEWTEEVLETCRFVPLVASNGQ